ncbi:MAG: hypothetical protein R3F02_11030 [Thiolinea sp.]
MTIVDEKFSEWTADQKLTFLETLSHHLTIEIRGIWSDDRLTAEKMVERIKWINELHHRLPMWARSVRLNQTDQLKYIGADIEHRANCQPIISNIIKRSVDKCIEFADREKASSK